MGLFTSCSTLNVFLYSDSSSTLVKGVVFVRDVVLVNLTCICSVLKVSVSILSSSPAVLLQAGPGFRVPVLDYFFF